MLDLIRKLSAEPREPTSPFTKKSLDYLAKELESCGYKPTLLVDSLQEWRATAPPFLELCYEGDPAKKSIPLTSATYSPSTPPEGLTGKLEPSEKITMLDSFEWESFVVLDEKSHEPIGRLIFTDYGSMPQPLPNNQADIPTAILPKLSIEEVKAFLTEEKASMGILHVPTETLGAASLPSLMLSPSQGSGPMPLVCAHIDSLHGSPGAHDNASGVAVAFEVAKFCAEKSLPCKFAFFNGEESNKVASSHYVRQFSATELSDLFSLVLEIDSVGIGQQLALLCSKKIRKKLRNLDWDLDSTPGFDIDINPQTKICFSDVWPFMQNGLPVIRMLSRDTVNRLDQEIMHSPNDVPETINEATLSFALSAAKRILQSDLANPQQG